MLYIGEYTKQSQRKWSPTKELEIRKKIPEKSPRQDRQKTNC